MQKEALTQQQVKMQPKVEALQGDLSGRQKKIDALQKRINDVKDRVFADFSNKVGSAGIVWAHCSMSCTELFAVCWVAAAAHALSRKRCLPTTAKGAPHWIARCSSPA